MRIAVIGPVYPYRGGMAHYTTMLYGVLRESGHEVLLISFKRQYPQWLFPGESDKDPSRADLQIAATHYWIDSLNPLTWLQTAREILHYAPDVFILQWWTTFWTPVWLVIGGLYRLLARRPLLMLAHCVLPHGVKRWDPWLARWGLSVGTHFITHSEEEKERLLKLHPKATVTVMSMPVFDLFGEAQISRTEARAQLRLPEDAPVVLFFGMIRPYKGLHDLLVAMPSVKSHLPNVKLLVAGEFWGDPQEYLTQIAALNLQECVILDNRYIPDDEVRLYLRAADVLALPYRRVTGSAVARLAFGAGCPVIASNVGDLGEIIEDGRNGLLVPPEDPQALAAAIVRFFVENLAEPVCAAVRADRQRFSWTILLEMLRAWETQTTP